jgi:hypothetical protein
MGMVTATVPAGPARAYDGSPSPCPAPVGKQGELADAREPARRSGCLASRRGGA